ncbi:hypothetical protein [Mycolicibacterium vaccae]|uniref:hypothetical protein n=1 Tax=Mycolicibacterium vaccae TaxID=1810 RepID=UPI003CFF0F04
MPGLKTLVRSAAAGTAVGGLLFSTAGVLAHAQPADPPSGPDGLVTVVVGGVTALDSAPLQDAAAAATEVCGGDPAVVAALAQQVDVEGAQQVVCTGSTSGDVLLVQNVAQESAPAEASPTPAPGPMETPPIPGEEEPAEPADEPAVPGDGEADESFNTEG